MGLLSKKKVPLSNKTLLNKVNLKLDKELVIDEDIFMSALMRVVPNCVGMSIKRAVELCKIEGIRYKLVGKEVIPKEGTVYDQSPKAGEKMKVLDELILYVNDHVTM